MRACAKGKIFELFYFLYVMTSFSYVNNGCARARIEHKVGNQSVRD